MKSKKTFIFPLIALGGLFFTSCGNSVEAIQGGSAYVNVTFDGNGGSIDGSLSKTLQIRKGLTWEYVSKSAPSISKVTRTGYSIIESSPWALNKDGSTTPSTTTKFTVDTTLYARYSANDIKIKLNPNGGTFSDSSKDSKEITVKYDSTFGKIKSSYTPTPPTGQLFTYYTNASNEVVGDDYIFTNNGEELKANYLTSEYIAITFDCNGGHIKDSTLTSTSVVEPTGTTWKTISTHAPTVVRDGYSQDTTNNWTITKNGTDKPLDGKKFESNVILYAKWNANDIKVKFNPNGGTIDSSTSTKEVSVKYDSTFGAIKASNTPTPPAGKEFTHYTTSSGKVVGDDYIFTNDNEELKANYLEVGSSINVTFDATSDGTIFGSQTRTYTIPAGLKWSVIKSNIVATPKDEAKEFKAFTYEDGAKSLADDTVLSKDMNNTTFKASYDYVAANDFATDSWGTVIHNASSLTNLKTAYGVTDTFVGKTRTVKIDNVDYTVKVIGEEHDVLASDKTTKTVLTFQFEDLVDDGVSYAYSHSASSDYANSRLKSYLNDKLYNKLPASLQSGIKAVNKKTYTVTSAAVNDFSDKVFTLSMSEMGYAKLPDDATEVKSEGSVYKAYETTTSESSYIKKAKGSTSASSYILRSPAFSGETGAIWGIDTDGKLGFTMSGHTYRQPESVNTGMGVFAAFAI